MRREVQVGVGQHDEHGTVDGRIQLVVGEDARLDRLSRVVDDIVEPGNNQVKTIFGRA